MVFYTPDSLPAYANQSVTFSSPLRHTSWKIKKKKKKKF